MNIEFVLKVFEWKKITVVIEKIIIKEYPLFEGYQVKIFDFKYFFLNCRIRAYLIIIQRRGQEPMGWVCRSRTSLSRLPPPFWAQCQYSSWSLCSTTPCRVTMLRPLWTPPHRKPAVTSSHQPLPKQSWQEQKMLPIRKMLWPIIRIFSVLYISFLNIIAFQECVIVV